MLVEDDVAEAKVTMPQLATIKTNRGKQHVSLREHRKLLRSGNVDETTAHGRRFYPPSIRIIEGAARVGQYALRDVRSGLVNYGVPMNLPRITRMKRRGRGMGLRPNRRLNLGD